MNSNQKSSATRAELMTRLRRIKGMGWFHSILFASGQSLLWLQRIVEAEETQCDGRHDPFRHLHDPIEDDPQFANDIEAAESEANAVLQDDPHSLGFCHLFWHTKKRILREKYGLEWFSPAEMNPDILFD